MKTLLTGEDDPAAKMIPKRSLRLNVSDPQMLSRVKKWLEDCHECHSNCNKCQLGEAKANIVPSYLLNINLSHDEVTLERVAAIGEAVSYSALSYCWGSEQPHQTTCSNLSGYQQGISISSLPRTIQDAITLSRILELRYLWVDSMCIIQDSAVHKQQELGIMGAIYHNAYVVISAASAATCHEGFLQDRLPPCGGFKVPFGTEGCVVLTLKLCTKLLAQGVRDPLDDRAWAYQESFIARRIIAFTTHEVIWSCVKTSGDNYNMRGTSAGLYFNDSCRLMLDQSEFRDWGFIVDTFSRRKLTRDSDKLPALSSIAELFDQGRRSQYLAGVWVGGLLQLLTWHTRPSFDKTHPPSRPQEWRAPSWSYLSINGPFGFSDLNDGRGTAEWNGFGWEAWNFRSQLLDQNNPFGEVTSASMSLKCRMTEVQVKKKTTEVGHRACL
jgi:hypothetical protein